MESIRRERARSLKFVQVAVLALVSICGALAVSTRGVELGLPKASTFPIALAFLLIGAVDTVLLFVWERIFQRVEF
jgi:hypothetical protein